jgi:hypothetical protein
MAKCWKTLDKGAPLKISSCPEPVGKRIAESAETVVNVVSTGTFLPGRLRK